MRRALHTAALMTCLYLPLHGCVEESDDAADDGVEQPDGTMVSGGSVGGGGGQPEGGAGGEPVGGAPAGGAGGEPMGGAPEGCPPESPEDACGVCGGDGPSTWFADVDGDGAGDDRITVEACEQPEGFVAEAGDPQPECATDDTDMCGVCGGDGVTAWYADQDEDGVGDALSRVMACEQPEGFVAEAGDPEPFCPTDDTDSCGVCAGGDADRDCVGVCFGEAALDGCNRCTGGTSEREPYTEDRDEDEIPDVCDLCHMDAARYVIQWTNIQPFRGEDGPYTFQLVLYENGDFVFLYDQIEPFGLTATVGHQGDGGENAVTLGHNSQLVIDHRVVYFYYREEDGRPEVDYAIPHPWIDVRSVGTPLELADDGDVVQDLPFNFPLHGEVYNQIRISANGLVGFGANIGGYNNEVLPQEDLGPIIAPLWDDLNPQRGGDAEIYIYEVPQEEACAQDCTGMFGGLAREDMCGQCAGGTSGVAPGEALDCNGVCYGEAYEDVCGACVGGDTGLEPSSPEDCPQGPDLMVVQDYLINSTDIEHLDVEDQCLVNERCVRGTGRRKIIRFGTRIANIGNTDLQLGRPEEGVDHWYWDDCHGHFHFEAYARYDLYNVNTEELLPIGSKNGFAVIDIGVFDPEIAVDGCRGYNGRNQGITAGCQDTYSRNLQCQWIDVTGVEDGIYDLLVTTNPCGEIEELDYTNNTARVRVEINGDQLIVTPDEALEDPIPEVDFAPLCRPNGGEPDPEADAGVIEEDAGLPDDADAGAPDAEMPDMGMLP